MSTLYVLSDVSRKELSKMARKPNPLEEKAIEMYKSGKQLVEIAKELGRPEGTIRRWKSTHNWDGDKEQIKTNVRKEVKNKNERSENKCHLVDKGIKETLENERLTDEQQLFCIYYIKEFNTVQAYQKAYGCSYKNACSNAWLIWNNKEVQKEVQRLKSLKAKQICFDVNDLVELQMRKAFASMENYMSFGKESVPEWKKVKTNEKDEYGNIVYEDVPVIDPNTGQQKINVYNKVDLKESENVDMQLVKEIKEGKDGISIKLVDSDKAIEWLSKYFEVHPSDRRKDEFTVKKLEMDMLRLELSQKDDTPPEQEDDGFLECLNTTAGDVWGGDAD